MVSYDIRIEYYGNKGKDAVKLITDWISLTVKKGTDSKSNNWELTVKNGLVNVNDSSEDFYEYLDDDNGNLIFEQNDIFKIYIKSQTSGDDTISTASDSLDLVTTAELIEWQSTLSNKTTKLKLKGVDKTFDVLNKIWAEAFTSTDAFNAPKMIQSVVQSVSDGISGSGFDDSGNLVSNGIYSIDARLFSESIVDSGTTDGVGTKKLIESGQNFLTTVSKGDMIRNTTDEIYASVVTVDSNTQLTISRDIFVSGEGYQIADGFIQDTRNTTVVASQSFPAKELSKVWKPAFEWCEDLSTTQFTNTDAELDATPIQNRKMVYYVDHKNRFHWFYPSDDYDYTFISGQVSLSDADVLSHSLTKKTYDSINMVIFNAGDDLDNLGTLSYFYDETTELNALQMKYYPMLDIAIELRRLEVIKGGITINADKTIAFTGSYDYTTSWGEVVGSDAAYKTAFRNKCISIGKTRANAITSNRASPRWKGTIEARFLNLVAGELIRYSSRPAGMIKTLIRVKDITHQITRSGVFTSISVEEDDKKIGV